MVLVECSYCSTPLKPTLEDKTIMDCSFCGNVMSVKEEWQGFILKRKQREDHRKILKRMRQEVESEKSSVTTESVSTASSKG